MSVISHPCICAATETNGIIQRPAGTRGCFLNHKYPQTSQSPSCQVLCFTLQLLEPWAGFLSCSGRKGDVPRAGVTTTQGEALELLPQPESWASVSVLYHHHLRFLQQELLHSFKSWLLTLLLSKGLSETFVTPKAVALHGPQLLVGRLGYFSCAHPSCPAAPPGATDPAPEAELPKPPCCGTWWHRLGDLSSKTPSQSMHTAWVAVFYCASVCCLGYSTSSRQSKDDCNKSQLPSRSQGAALPKPSSAPHLKHFPSHLYFSLSTSTPSPSKH